MDHRAASGPVGRALRPDRGPDAGLLVRDLCSRKKGEDRIVIGTDYSHSDNSTEMEAITHLLERTDVEPHVLRKIVEDNPKALYSL